MAGIRPFTGRKLTVGRVGGVYTPPTGGGGGGPAVRSSSYLEPYSDSFSITKPAGVASGDLLVMVYSQIFNPKGGSSHSPPAGWTQRATEVFGTYTNKRITYWTKVAGASEPATYDFTGANNWYSASVGIVAISGASAFDSVGSAFQTSTTSIATANAVTTTATNDVLLFIATAPVNSGSSGAKSATVPTGMTSVLTSTSLADNRMIIAKQTLSAAGSTGTRSSSFYWYGIISPPSPNGDTRSILVAVK